MIPQLFYRRRAARFAQLLDEADGNRRHRARARVNPDLVRLVAISEGLRAVRPPADVDPNFRVSLRSTLLAKAEREGIGATATEMAPTRAVPDAPVRTTLQPALVTVRSRPRPRTMVISAVAAGAIAVSGISVASESVPGDTLYRVKRSAEQAQLALASSDVSRAHLHLDFARTRLVEAGELRGQPSGVVRSLDEMDADTREGVRLLTTTAVQRRDPAVLNPVAFFLTEQRGQLTELQAGGTRTERERANESLVLLDSVRRRADAIRAALDCGAAAPTAFDSFGPVPQHCGAERGSIGAGLPTENRPDGLNRQTPGSEATNPTPGPSSDPRGPGPFRIGPEDLTDPNDDGPAGMLTPDTDEPLR